MFTYIRSTAAETSVHIRRGLQWTLMAIRLLLRKRTQLYVGRGVYIYIYIYIYICRSSSILSTVSDVNILIGKDWSTIDKFNGQCKPDLSDKTRNRNSSNLKLYQYYFMVATLIKSPKHTRNLCAVLNKS